MRFRLPPYIWLAALGLLPAVAWAANDAGTESALYLGAGARAVAMGRSGVTDTGAVFAADWNPAGLADVPRCALGLQHALLFDGAIHDTAGFVYPDLDLGTFSLTWTRLALTGIERRDASNLPDGDFSYTEQQLALAYGRQVWGPLALGGVFKVHDLRLDNLESMAPGFDAGLLATFPKPWASTPGTEEAVLQTLRAGFFVRNAVGPRIKLQDEADRLNPEYRLGVGGDLRLFSGWPNQLRLALDLEKPEMAGMRFHAGAEFACYDHFALRGGWDQEYPSLGAGINYAGFDLDYAVSFPVLGLRHLMTLTFAFGDDMAAARAHRQNDLERQKQQVIQGLKDEMIAGYLHQANEAYGGGDLRQAVMLWEKALDWDPNNQEAKQKLQSAQEELQRRQVAASLALAGQHYEAGEYLDAILECRKVLEIDPQNGQALQINARAEKQASSFGAAATTAEVQSVAKARDFYLKGLKAYTSQNWAEAVKNWEKAAEQTPLQQQIMHSLDQARQHLTAAGQSLPEGLAPAPAATPVVVQKLYKEAVDLSRTGKLSDAVQTWEKLIKENPADEDAKKNLDKTRQDLIDSQKRGLKW